MFLLTIISAVMLADTKIDSNLREKTNKKSWAVTKEQRLEEMMRRYQGE